MNEGVTARETMTPYDILDDQELIEDISRYNTEVPTTNKGFEDFMMGYDTLGVIKR